MNPLLFLFGLLSARQVMSGDSSGLDDDALAADTLGLGYGRGDKDKESGAKKDTGAGRNKNTEDSSGGQTDGATIDPESGDTTTSQETTTQKSDPAPTGDPTFVTPPTQTGDNSSGIDSDGGIDVTIAGQQVISGRVHTIDTGADVESVRIIGGPEHGNVTVNPDNSLALVLTQTGYTGALSFRYEITKTDGTVETVETEVDAVAGPLAGGWGEGSFYMLETDDNGGLVVEWGDNHRDVYMSGSDNALTLADIARLEGIDVSQISSRWLADHPEYGSSEEMALAEDAGKKLWLHLGKESLKEPASHWLHLEAGYTYDIGMDSEEAKTGAYSGGMHGESELHPLHITAYGEGDKPIIEDELMSLAASLQNVVFSGVELTGARFVGGENVIFDGITTDEHLIVQSFDNFTLRNSTVHDVMHDAPIDGGDYWDPAPNRISGIYSSHTDGLLIENTLFDHNSWADDYREDLSAEGGQAPSMYSHNIYLATTTSDVTIRDTITMRAASFGAQVRGGGFLEDNVFLDNNAGVFVSGAYKDTNADGNYSLYADNLVTSGAHKEADELIGYLAHGMGDYAPLTSHVDNIIAHLADPNNPEEQAEKTTVHHALNSTEEAYYRDTIIYNWIAEQNPAPNENIEGLNTSVLDATTIQNFTSQLLGKDDATIADLAVYLRDNSGGYFDDKTNAEIIIDFFQAGFGLTPDGRLDPALVRFTPNDVADGIRWDNRLNWSTEDLPGSVEGDSVDLAGNWVNYGGTTKITDLYFGDGGRLNVEQGRLDVTGDMQTDSYRSELNIDGAGQVWIDGYSDTDRLNIDVFGGRFANTGDMQGKTYLDIRDGQALLATEGARFDVHGGGRIKIIGDEAKVGFEGTDGGTAVLRFDEGGTLRFEAGADGAFGQISEFRSGANGDADVNVQSGVNFGEGRLELNLSGVTSGAASYRLVDVDQMIGAFSEIDVTGLAGDRDARLVFDYEQDAMVLRITEAGAGTGDLDLVVRGEDQDAMSDIALWDALTADHAPLPDNHMPDEVTVNGEALALV